MSPSSRPSRRLSVMPLPNSASSSVTLVNSPRDAGRRERSPPGLSRKRRKSVAFSPITHIIHPRRADRSDFPDEVENYSPRRRVPISDSCSHYQLLPNGAGFEEILMTTSKAPYSGSPLRRRPLVQSTGTRFECRNLSWRSEQAVALSGGLFQVTPPVAWPSPHFHSTDATLLYTSFPDLSPSRSTFVTNNCETSPLQDSGCHNPLPISEPFSSPSSCVPQLPFTQDRAAYARYPSIPRRDFCHPICDSSAGQSTQPQPFHQIEQAEQSTSVIVKPTINQLPPAHVCAEVNNEVRTTFDLSMFDLVEHVRRRKYVIRKRCLSDYPQDQPCVTILDTTVDFLFPSPSALPAPPSPFAPPQELFDIRPAFALSSSPKHKLKPDSLSKGMGMFASISVPANATIVVERPVLVVPYVLASTCAEEAYEQALALLDDAQREAIMDLAASPLIQDAKNVCEAIMRLNSMAIRLTVPSAEDSGYHGELETHKAIFLNGSRINHSCSPNATWEWDLETFSLVVKSVRPIAPGEEITISYVSPFLAYEHRRDVLFQVYGFRCACTSCVDLAGPLASNPKEIVDEEVETKILHRIEESNMARKMLASFWDVDTTERPSFEQWCQDLSLPSDLLIKAHMQALALIQREGLEILDAHPDSYPPTWTNSRPTAAAVRVHPLRDLGRHIDAIAMCYGALEDVENFNTWITKAADARGLKLKGASDGKHRRRASSDSRDEKSAFVQWLANPLSFPVWGWRSRSNLKDIKREPSMPAGSL